MREEKGRGGGGGRGLGACSVLAWLILSEERRLFGAEYSISKVYLLCIRGMVHASAPLTGLYFACVLPVA